MKKIILKDNITDYLFMLLGILCISFALKSLLMPNNFFDGGVTGIALLLYKKYHINIALIFILLNIPFVLLGGKLINKSFAIKSLIGVILLGICLYFIPFPEVSHDDWYIGLGWNKSSVSHDIASRLIIPNGSYSDGQAKTRA
jgi:uncharacterized membrane-anchored protein YitT (DUF2179 family)